MRTQRNPDACADVPSHSEHNKTADVPNWTEQRPHSLYCGSTRLSAHISVNTTWLEAEAARTHNSQRSLQEENTDDRPQQEMVQFISPKRADLRYAQSYATNRQYVFSASTRVQTFK